MANDLNNCQFIGRLGADPEIRYMPNGDPVVNFRMAVGWKTKTTEGTEWISIVVFGKLAEICGEYLKKGSQVFIGGRFKTRKWQAQDGSDRYSTEIIADTMQMLGSRDAKPDSNSVEKKSKQTNAPHQQDANDYDDFNDDLPF